MTIYFSGYIALVQYKYKNLHFVHLFSQVLINLLTTYRFYTASIAAIFNYIRF